MNNLSHSFGNNLSSIRKNKGLTQEDLAERSGISVDFLSLIERGLRAPSFSTIESLSIALDVEVKELFDFSSDTF
jgi:transcriptional regulator with XRE-family HTH domain